MQRLLNLLERSQSLAFHILMENEADTPYSLLSFWVAPFFWFPRTSEESRDEISREIPPFLLRRFPSFRIAGCVSPLKFSLPIPPFPVPARRRHDKHLVGTGPLLPFLFPVQPFSTRGCHPTLWSSPWTVTLPFFFDFGEEPLIFLAT